MKGYKVFDKDWKCRDFQYEIGKTYEMDEKPEMCKRGFHFCMKLIDCFDYYKFNPNNKVAEVEALGNVYKSKDNSKCCTNKIKIVKELSWHEVLDLVNTGIYNTGKSNTGNHNSGNYNSGDFNSGIYNSSDYNLGNYNSGNRNIGDRNTGNYNSGNRNSGDFDIGSHNTGNCNSGYNNSGDYNSGNCNSGNFNSGNFNSGNYNSGNYNSGCFNTSNYNLGCFNTDNNDKIIMFNKPCNWILSDFYLSFAYRILINMPKNGIKWISEYYMTDDEKKDHPEYETTCGYLKQIIVGSEDKQKWWDKLSNGNKKAVMSLPNFDPDIFYECTGIKTHDDYAKFKDNKRGNE